MRTPHPVRESSKVGRRGTVVIPQHLRKQFGFEEGSLIVVEAKPDGVLIRPAVALPVEVYTPRRKAEFLLNNAVTVKDYRRARSAVKAMGLDPDDIPHDKPTGR